MLERGWKKIAGAAGSTDGSLEGLPQVPRGVSDRMTSEADREKRLERYEQVREFHERGLGILTISRLLDMSRGAVRKYVHARRASRSVRGTPADRACWTRSSLTS
jgi:hypothetical protein